MSSSDLDCCRCRHHGQCQCVIAIPTLDINRLLDEIVASPGYNNFITELLDSFAVYDITQLNWQAFVTHIVDTPQFITSLENNTSFATWVTTQGSGGGVLNFADYYALMPGDNAATVAVGGDVQFPQTGPLRGTDIARNGASPTTFALALGTYQVQFQVSVSEAGQLVLTLNGAEIGYTVVGRAVGATQIVGMALVVVTVPASLLTVRNPAGNSTALTITPIAGGASPVSAHLIITKIQ